MSDAKKPAPDIKPLDMHASSADDEKIQTKDMHASSEPAKTDDMHASSEPAK
ncbi:hypothetical protein ACH4SP_30115 [Streptomyces sp. NPDC021093]|uniref:hypothetical protein n=1 Tax=Streptomyces sp. NPDC021093 TaxID=3365112 RepID=UPI00379C9F08